MNMLLLNEFRQHVRDFCQRELPEQLKWKVSNNQDLTKDDHVGWQKLLRKHGYFGAGWPVAHGGQGWTKLQQWVFEQELYRAGAPWIIPFGVSYVGPVIYTFGNDEQRGRYLPAILSSDVWWCQGYSEPNAGSDLALLTTRAERVADGYIVNGQKTWTTMAHWADMIFLLARTAANCKPQEGISFFVVDMATPGITVRPIDSIDGCHHLNEVFFEDVLVPARQLIGEENQGWTYAKFVLSNERLLAAEIGKSHRLLGRLYTLLEAAKTTVSWRDEPTWLYRAAEINAEVLALEALCLDFLEADGAGRAVGPEVSSLKILGSELTQEISSLALDIAAGQGLSYQAQPEPRGGAGVVHEYLHARAATIYGGSNEVQRNIIAKGLAL